MAPPAAAMPDGVSRLGVLFRGFLMGLAEVVPGVSGGTIAFVTGIYQPLVTSIASFGPRSLVMLRHWQSFAAHHQIAFLLWLAAGMGAGILVFARIMQFLLAHYQPVVWGFFGGVIGMSVWVIGRARNPRTLLGWAPLGMLAGLSMLWLPQMAVQPASLQIFAGGALAVCAWLLPAVSGSFVLLALGLYAPVIAAVAGFDITFIIIFAAGCITGLLLFSRLLAWLLQRHGEALLSLLTGFMLGSLTKLWPWQGTQASGWDNLLLPLHYTQLHGDAFLPWVVLAVLAGASGLGMLSRITGH